MEIKIIFGDNVFKFSLFEYISQKEWLKMWYRLFKAK